MAAIGFVISVAFSVFVPRNLWLCPVRALPHTGTHSQQLVCFT